MINKKKLSNSKGFTLTELLVVIFVLVLIIRLVYSGYLLSHRSYLEAEKMTEITQNGRVILERTAREIRQAREIATELAEEESGATSTIEFEDGHISESYHYIRYFKEGAEVKREIVGYYFSGDPSETLVSWDAEPPGSQTLETKVLESSKTIGECVSGLGFWGSEVVNIFLVLEKENKALNLKTKVFGRNL